MHLPSGEHVVQRTLDVQTWSRAANFTESCQRAKPRYSFGAGVTSALCLSPPTNTHRQRAHLAWQKHRINETENTELPGRRIAEHIIGNCRRLNTPCVERQLARVQTGEEYGASVIKRRHLPTRSTIHCDDNGAHSDVTPRNLPARKHTLLLSGSPDKLNVADGHFLV